MASGDGLVVRVRPPQGRLSAGQALQLAELARVHGSGVLELSSRANVQLRGIAPDRHAAVLDILAGCGLLDADARRESLRTIVLDPLWQPGDGVRETAQALEAALFQPEAQAALQGLPAKFGWLVAGRGHRALAGVPADIRLLCLPAGRAAGTGHRWHLLVQGLPRLLVASTLPAAIAAALELARWCADQSRTRKAQGLHPGRMAGLLAQYQAAHHRLPDWQLPAGASLQALEDAAFCMPSAPDPAPGRQGPDGPYPGLLAGAPLGRLSANALSRLARVLRDTRDRDGQAPHLRITPWRMLLIEGRAWSPAALRQAGLDDAREWITDAGDARLRVCACTGAPGCSQALAPTLDLALQLAPQVPPGALLHVSGCAKGCARQRPADITLRAQAGTAADGTPTASFAVVQNGTARDVAQQELEACALRDNPRLFSEKIEWLTSTKPMAPKSIASPLPPYAAKPS